MALSEKECNRADNAEVLATDSVSPETKHSCGLLARRKNRWEAKPKNVEFQFRGDFSPASRAKVFNCNSEPVAIGRAKVILRSLAE
jgi:hypothetical protein